jgi:hypothetical protein
LAEQELFVETLSYRKDVTGVDNTLFIPPKGNTRHAARITLAIEPPHTVDPRGRTAVIAIADGTIVAGDVPPRFLEQVGQFIDANREVLLDYWDYRVDTEMLRQRLRRV